MRDRVVLFDMESFTTLEGISFDEETERERLIEHFLRDTHKCLLRLSVVMMASLDKDVDRQRLSIASEEKMSRNELLRVLELQRHGCSLVMIHEAQASDGSVMRLLHDPPPPPPDESWRQLPQLLDVNEEPIDVHKASYSVHSLSLKLGEQLTLWVSRLEREEEDRRQALCGDEQSTFRLLLRSFERERDGLLQIERTIEADVRQLTLCRLPPEEREEFVLGPCRTKAAATRNFEELTEEATRAQFMLGMEYLIAALRIRESSDAAALIVQEERTQRCLDRLQQLQLQTHGVDVFRRWQAGADRFKKRRTVYPKALKVLRLRTVRVLLHRYCVNWFQSSLQPKRLEELHAFFNSADESRIYIDVSESEERSRVVSIMSEVQLWEATLESFFLERDRLLKVQREQQAALLAQQNEGRHRLTTLAAWFRFARSRRDGRRANFLFAQNQNRHRTRALDRWKAAMPLLRRFGPASRQLRQKALTSLSYTALELLEDHGRLLFNIAQELRQLILTEQHTDELTAICEQALIRRLDVLERNAPRQHMSLRWHTFLTWTVLRKQRVGVMFLARKSALHLLILRWSAWVRHVEQSQQQKRSIAFERQQAHERQMVEEAADLARVRLADAVDVVFRKLQGRAHRPPTDLQVRSMRLQLSRQQQVFSPWRRMVRLRRQAMNQAPAAGIERLAANCNFALLTQSYHKWITSIQKQKSTDRLVSLEQSQRDQLQATDAIARQHMYAKRALRLQQVNAVQLEEAQRTKAVILSHWMLWSRWLHRRKGQLQVEKLAPVALCRRAMWCWLRSVRHKAALARLAIMAAASDRALRQKYLRRMMPATVRLMKVSKAKANLDRAQAAARVLQHRSFTAAGDENRSSPRTPVLPPLKR